jgi:hypothetical protein
VDNEDEHYDKLAQAFQIAIRAELKRLHKRCAMFMIRVDSSQVTCEFVNGYIIYFPFTETDLVMATAKKMVKEFPD